jgi:DNA-binding transcriptional regulator YhcF (GntR family)
MRKMLKTTPAGGNGGTRPAPRKPAPRATAKSAPSSRRGADAIALVQSSSLPALVQQELERMILAGELPAGSKLNEAAIAERLGVSRGPVREAFRALEESGLVELEKNRGVFVREIRIEEADEIYELRAVLDEFVGGDSRRRRQPMRCASSPIESTGWSGPPAKATSLPISRPTSIFTTGWSSSRATRSCSACTAGSSTSCISSATRRWPKGGVLPVSMREHRAIVERSPLARRSPRAARCTTT